MCFTMADQKTEEQEIGREAIFHYAEPGSEEAAEAADPPSVSFQSISLNTASSSSTEFDSLSETSTGPLDSDFNNGQPDDNNNNDGDTVEYYLSEPNAETGEDNLRRLHITRSLDGLPLFTVRAENYSTTARFGPSPYNENRFVFEHDYQESSHGNAPDSPVRNEYSDYLAAATVFMQEFPNGGEPQMSEMANPKQSESPMDGSGEGRANLPPQDFNFLGQQNYGSPQHQQEFFNSMEPSGNGSAGFQYPENDLNVPNNNFSHAYLPSGPMLLPPRGSGLGILGVAPVALPVVPVGVNFGTIGRNGTTYYNGNPPVPAQFQQQHYQRQFVGMGIASNVYNQRASQGPLFYPQQPQFPMQPIARASNFNPFLANQSHQPVMGLARAVPQGSGVLFAPLPALPPRLVAGRPYFVRRAPGSHLAQPLYSNQSQQPQPVPVAMAVPTYGVGFPQPPHSTNGVQYTRVNGPDGVHFVPSSPTHGSNPYQQQQPSSPFAFIPQSPVAQQQHSNRFFHQEPTSTAPLPYENFGADGFDEISESQGQEQGLPPYVDYYTGQPLMYYPGTEPVMPEPTPSMNYSPNVYYYTETEDNQNIVSNGFQLIAEEKSKSMGLSQYMAQKLMDSTPETTPRTSTAESGDTEVSKLSWSQMMEEEENAYEASASADSDDNRTGLADKGSDTSGTLKYRSEHSGDAATKGKDVNKMGNSSAGERVREILKNMVDYGNTFCYLGQEFPYVASVWDEKIMASIRLPRRHFDYYVPPKVRDDDFFGGQQMLWQMKMMEGFSRFSPDVWRIQALPDFESRGVGWTSFDLTSKLRFCCRSCRRPWTSMRGKVVFAMKFDNLAQRGIILMKIFGQVCIQGACTDFDFQTPACYPEEIQRVIWKLSEYVGCVFYGIALSPTFYSDPDKAIRTGHPSSAHRKEFCQACQSGFCSKGVVE